MALTQGEREAGWRTVTQPNPLETRILARIARGFLLVTQSEDGPTFCYDDGAKIHVETMRKGRVHVEPMGEKEFHRFSKNGWILPIEGEGLFPDAPAQRYRARTANDPVIPKIIKRY